MRRVASIAGLLAGGCLSPPTEATSIDASPDVVVDDGGGGAADRSWATVLPESDPDRLYGPKLVYDPVNEVVLMFGGSLGIDETQAVSQFWRWDGDAWELICEGCGPQARIGHGFAYDTDRGRPVLTGGIDINGDLIDDMWEWNGKDWESIDAMGAPATPRANMWLGYHAMRRRVVMFGGDIGPDERSNQLFEWDGETWTFIASGDGPSERSDGGAAMPYDPDGDRLLVYGGEQPEHADDLWAWNGTTWARLCSDCTGRPRSAAALAVDPARDRILIVNGYDGTDIAGTVELDQDGDPACLAAEPSQRDSGSIAHDTGRDVFVYYGGNGAGCGGNCWDTLELAPADEAGCE